MYAVGQKVKLREPVLQEHFNGKVPPAWRKPVKVEDTLDHGDGSFSLYFTGASGGRQSEDPARP